MPYQQKRKTYVPRMRTKEELLDQVKYKKSWKGSGNGNDFFMQPPIMRPKILDPWTSQRVQQPERAYAKFFASKSSQVFSSHVKLSFNDQLSNDSWFCCTIGSQKPFGYTSKNLVEFGAPSEKEGMSGKYMEFLKD